MMGGGSLLLSEQRYSEISSEINVSFWTNYFMIYCIWFFLTAFLVTVYPHMTRSKETEIMILVMWQSFTLQVFFCRIKCLWFCVWFNCTKFRHWRWALTFVASIFHHFGYGWVLCKMCQKNRLKFKRLWWLNLSPKNSAELKTNVYFGNKYRILLEFIIFTIKTQMKFNIVYYARRSLGS